MSNVAEPTIAHTANLTMENLEPNGPSSLSEKSLVIEHLNVEPSAPPAPPEWTVIYVQPVAYNIQPMGEIKLF